jgi:branched-chain amino acid transport system substrate-binding protein
MDNKVILAPLSCGGSIKTYRPYLIGGYDYYPRFDLMKCVWIKEKYPEVERVAMLVQEDATGHESTPWIRSGWESMGVEVVYDKKFSVETTDFAPVISAVLQTDPDVVDMMVSYPGWATLQIEQLYLQGFDGVMAHNCIDLEPVLEKVPAEWLAGFVDSYPYFNDPWYGEPSLQHDIYNEWMARYGPGSPDDVYRLMTGIDWLYASGIKVWLEGVKLAGTLDPDIMLPILRDAEVETWGGTAYFPEAAIEIYGIQNLYEQPLPVCEVQPNGEKRIQAMMDLWSDWYPVYGEILRSNLEAAGQAKWAE